MRVALAVGLVAMGCGDGPRAGDVDAGITPDADPGSGLVCSPDNVGFNIGASQGGLARGMAAGGAKVVVIACMAPGAHSVRSAATTDANVATVTLVDTWSRPARGVPEVVDDAYLLEVLTGVPGDTDLVLYDADGVEVTRGSIQVVATTDLVVDRGWGNAPGPTVLAWTSHCLHTTTKVGDEVLAGFGAVRFTFSGDLRADPAMQGECGLSDPGDSAFFTATGDGIVEASCPDATAMVPITVVSPSALTSIVAPTAVSFQSGGLVTVGALAGDTPVYGVMCTWTAPAALTFKVTACDDNPLLGSDGACAVISMPRSGFLGAGAPLMYVVTGPPGDYVAHCAVPGGLAADIAVHISP